MREQSQIAPERLWEDLDALEQRGIKTFPVGTDKRPRCKWKGIAGEGVEERRARWHQYLAKGLPFLVAAIPGNDYVVLDVDDEAEFNAALNGSEVEFEGPQVLTPSGGFQVWHRRDGEQFKDCDWG